MDEMQIIQLVPNKWVSESVLMAITGLKKNTIKRAREQSWMEGREYKHLSPDGYPRSNSMCFYNREAIDRWIEGLPVVIPRREKHVLTP
ncbi:TPA: excisionase family protein [Serratia marcescens]|nr:excisionase family protein [Serratia marcescens]